MTSEGYHEPLERLTDEAMDRHRAIASLMEELEAVDWYEQRITATNDPELAAILRHNSDEEKEHAAMVLEWLRRRDAVLDEQLRTYLFTEGPIADVEGSTSEVPPASSGDLGVRTTGRRDEPPAS
jgi:ferritin-like protein